MAKKSYNDQREEKGSPQSGEYCVKASCGLYKWRPSWEHGSWIRILPAKGPDGEPLPWRNSDTEWDLTDWIRADQAAGNIGTEEKISFNSIPSDYDESTFLELPYTTFRNRLYRMRSDERHRSILYPLFHLTDGQYPAAPRDSVVAYVQCVIVNTGGKEHLDNPIKNVVFQLPKTAREALEDFIEQRDPKLDKPDDPFAKFVYRDILDLDSGRWVHILDRSKQRHAAITPEIDYDGKGSSGGDREFKGYTVELHEKFQGLPPKLPRRIWDECVKDFDDVLRYMTVSEMVKAICTAFRPEVARLGFMGTTYEDFIPHSVMSSKKASTPPPKRQSETTEEPDDKPDNKPDGESEKGGGIFQEETESPPRDAYETKTESESKPETVFSGEPEGESGLDIPDEPLEGEELSNARNEAMEKMRKDREDSSEAEAK